MGWFRPQGGSQDNARKSLLPLSIRGRASRGAQRDPGRGRVLGGRPDLGRAPLHPRSLRILHGRRRHLHAGGAAGLPPHFPPPPPRPPPPLPAPFAPPSA